MTSSLPIDLALRRYLDEQTTAAGPVRSAWDARKRLEKQLECRGEIPGLPNHVHAADHFAWTGKETGLRVRLYTPPAPAAGPRGVLVYLHGGGWVAGSIETHDPFCRLLTELAEVCIASVDYRRAPEHPYPAPLEDAHAAYLWLHEHAESLGVDAEKLAIGGDSAGANLAAAAANRLVVEVNAPPLRALVLLYPVTDHYSAGHASYVENAIGYGLEAESMRWYWDQYAGGAAADDPSLSPLRMGVLPRLPPTLVLTAGYDVLRDEGIAYARQLEAAGVAVTHHHAADMHHDFAASPATVALFPQSTAALGQVAAFLRSQLG